MSTILQTPKLVQFDAKNAEHRKAYVAFLNEGKWPFRFDLEYPFTSLPSMIMFKLSMEACSDVGTVDSAALFSKAFTINPGVRLGMLNS